jgi:putative ABC transport system permease protein
MKAMLLPALLRHASWPEWRLHPWRHAVALLAVALGVALAFSVHLINGSALAEFSAAVRAANGEPDLTLRAATRAGFDDTLYERAARAAGVAAATPVVEVDSVAWSASGGRVPIRVLGIDALTIAPLAPSLLPRADASVRDRLAVLDPTVAFLNPAALQRLGLSAGDTLRVQQGTRVVALRVAGTVGAGGAPLAVMDIAAAQRAFERAGRLSRIDLRLDPGVPADAVQAALQLPPQVQAVAADAATQRVSALSRADRVNLTVLALVALFVGAFLVFSVMALSVAQRTPGFALLGVLGLSARERRHLVLAESLGAGVVGSALGIALGTALALFALQLRFSWSGAAVFGALGVAAALAGGWLPAQDAAALSPAQALKGLGGQSRATRPWLGPALLAAGAAFALLPPLFGLPLAAYVSVALLLVGGIAAVPAIVQGLLGRVRPGRSALALLALSRARHERDAATVAVAGVVASLSLAVALTVMVASFRDGVARWLDTVLPADLYVRTATTTASGDGAFLPAGFVAAARGVPGVARVEALRAQPLQLDPARPAVVLIARTLADPAQSLPLLDPPLPPGTGIDVFVSEAMVALYGASPGSDLDLPGIGRVRVRGVWRDYARQFGAVAIDEAAYRRITGDDRVNDLALWLAPGADAADVQGRLRALSPEPALLEFGSVAQIRAQSLAIFDRSFAVTYYLQALAIGIGLFGIAASFSAQVMARRREFGLLAHLGLTRAQVVAVVAGEGAAWTAAGALLGLALGLAVSVVLVHVVNPQSFHWTMELLLPWPRLAALFGAVLAAGSVTAAVCARAAAGHDAVLAVKEDW